MCRLTHCGRASGIALLSVLFLIALLTVMAVAVLGIVRTRTQIVGQQIQIAQTNEALDSAIRLVLLELATPQSSQVALWTGETTYQRRLTLFERKIELRGELEAGRVDINFASEETLADILVAGGYPRAQAQLLARRAIDWRDADETALSDGAERAQYLQARLGYSPRNAPFEAVGELRQVLGWQDVSELVLDAFTVYTHVADASPLSSIPLVQAARKAQGIQIGTSPPDTAATQSLAGQVVRMHACLSDAAGTCRVAVVRLTGSQRKLFLTYWWQTEYPSVPVVTRER
jgi:general secretion pathway protein K